MAPNIGARIAMNTPAMPTMLPQASVPFTSSCITDTLKYWGNSAAILGNSGDRVDLIDADDEVLLRHEWPNPHEPITDYGIVIDRVNFDAPGSDNDNPNGEFLTIRNSSTTEQNLVNWKLEVGPEQLVFLEDTPLAAGASLTVYMGTGTNTADSIYSVSYTHLTLPTSDLV